MKNTVALSGGVGGAKLVLGLSQVLEADALTVIANTADDFEHLGLFVCPDLDSIMYALAGLDNQQLGWGVKDETWQCMKALGRLQAQTWFNLGDQDIATHLLRTQALRQGQSLTTISQDLYQRLAIKTRVLPMCDEKVSTLVHSQQGDLAFQHYFVRERCQPEVTGFSFQGIENARLAGAQKEALEQMQGLIICPSNPFVSVEPILSLPGVREIIKATGKPVAVVSPIIAGQAVKGPAAMMMKALKMPVTALGVAQYYQNLATHFILDEQDSHLKSAIESLGFVVWITNTLMQNLDDKKKLANEVLKAMYG